MYYGFKNTDPEQKKEQILKLLKAVGLEEQ